MRSLFQRRAAVGGASVVGAGLLGKSLSARPGSARFYGLTLGTAATWVAGGLAAGRVPLGRSHGACRSVATPVVVGAGAFAAFYAAALAAHRVPVLDRAVSDVLEYAHRGSDPLVLLTTLANGVAEEVFFRGALYGVAGSRHPVAVSTAAYALATTPTRNPALVLASVVMGALFGLQRRATGGIQAPMLTHLTWSTLMLRYLPPLFRRAPAPPT
ncbi:MAG: family intrarane metalloprotease [Pseudonocardia sp.]|nr:family intrarane metalloprotease [Pseudonocardia sp.]